jgi:hypothetical protein
LALLSGSLASSSFYVIVRFFSSRFEEHLSVRYLLIALLAMLPVAFLITHYKLLDRSGDFHFRDHSRTILASVAPDASIFTEWVSGWPLIYVQKFDELRPDVAIEFAASSETVDFARAASAGRPVYFWGIEPTESTSL